MSERHTGVVASFDAERGLGDVREGDAVRPFHCTAIADGSRSIEVGAAVSFVVVPGPLGRWEAADIRAADPRV